MKPVAFVIDDELLAIKRLARMLEATGRVELAGSASDPIQAVAEVAALGARVELVFVDISMPGLDGFEVCARLPPHVMVVFTTAHGEHALQAFQTNAIDYLMKPIRDDELRRALDKHERLRELPAAEAHAQLAAAMQRIAGSAPQRIASRLGDRIHFIELERITHFVAEDKLTYALTAERSYVIEPTISDLELRYPDYVRIHRATLVRVGAIAELHATADGTKVRLGDGKELAVARERVKSLKERLGLG